MIRTFIKQILLVLILCIAISGVSQESYEIMSMGFNTSGAEYAPQYYQDGIVYCSDQIRNKGITYQDSKTGKSPTNLFYIRSNEMNASNQKIFDLSRKSCFYDGPITFSKDFRTAYFTRTINVDGKLKGKTKKKFGVYKTTYDGEEWGNVTSCPFNSLEYNVGQPTLSVDGTVLYVVSDKEGGLGGTDIYYSKITNDSCGKLVSVGNDINTKNNEMFPFVNSKNQLYFSSDKPLGKGGLDIYMGYGKFNLWSIPVALDSSINSTKDDFSLIFNDENTEGYFSSNRSGSDDIFKINISFPLFENCVEILKEQLCYEFYEEATVNQDSVLILYEWDFGDGVKEEGLEVSHCYEKSGDYIVSLNAMDPMIDVDFLNQDVYELNIEEVIQPKISCPDSVLVDTPFKVTIEQGKWRDYSINTYYIDYGDSNIIKNDVEFHQYSVAGIVEVKILIAGVDNKTGEILTNCFYKSVKVIGNVENYSELSKLGSVDFDEKGKMEIILRNISFKFNTYQLNDESKLELNKLFDYLNINKNVEITINAYTDAARDVEKTRKIFENKGLVYSKEAHDKMSSSYNEELSKNRATSVYNYLIEKGIDESRLNTIGHGEKKPLALNYFSDGLDNPEGRKKNRRVSFTIH